MYKEAFVSVASVAQEGGARRGGGDGGKGGEGSCQGQTLAPLLDV